jgi:hypothetical protein
MPGGARSGMHFVDGGKDSQEIPPRDAMKVVGMKIVGMDVVGMDVVGMEITGMEIVDTEVMG